MFHAHQKVAHRAANDVHVGIGNHDAVGTGLLPLRGWLPIEVFHFSFRTVAQVEDQREARWSRPAPDLAEHIALLGRAAAEGRIKEHLRGLTVDDVAVRAGLADGTLAIDTRLRDALPAFAPRRWHVRASRSGRSGSRRGPPPDPQQDAEFAAEVAPLVEIDGVIRAEERIRALERRLEDAEQGARNVARRLTRR